MSRKRPNPHKNFMVFNAVLFFAVLFITALFLYMSYAYKRNADKVVTYEGRYHIEVLPHFAGESLQGDMLMLCSSVEADNILCVAGDTANGRVFAAKITFGE